MNRHIIFAFVCILIAVLNCGCIGNDKENVVTMTIEELINDYKQSSNNTTKTYSYQLESLDDGDVLIIKDTLNNVLYQEPYQYTLIDFGSAESPPFAIEGNITDKFRNGDDVELKVHIIHVIFVQQLDNETWTIELETFQEGWDSETNTSVPIPQSYLKLLEDGEGKVVTMTIFELVDDYNESWNNSTRKITGVFNSLEDGDTLIIKDTLNSLVYNESGGYTLIDFETLPGSPFSIEGDITDNFKQGDIIELTLKVIKVIFRQQNPYTGEIWTFEHETFKEEWDSANNVYIPIPQQYIRHA